MKDINKLIERIELHLSLSYNDEMVLRKELLNRKTDSLDDWDLVELASLILEEHSEKI